jgi:hypothetical protein
MRRKNTKREEENENKVGEESKIGSICLRI